MSPGEVASATSSPIHRRGPQDYPRRSLQAFNTESALSVMCVRFSTKIEITCCPSALSAEARVELLDQGDSLLAAVGDGLANSLADLVFLSGSASSTSVTGACSRAVVRLSRTDRYNRVPVVTHPAREVGHHSENSASRRSAATPIAYNANTNETRSASVSSPL